MFNINKYRALTLFLFLMGFSSAIYAVGESSVITLEFPAGGENTGMAESGASQNNSIYTMFWNPASLPAVYDNLQTRLQVGLFSEKLMPKLNMNINHDFYTGAVFLNDLFPHIDIAYGFYENQLENMESVNAHCLGIRAFNMLSLGVSLKRYNSYNRSGDKVNGGAFDFGVRLEHTARIASTPLTVMPALGLSVVNIGNDVVDGKSLPKGFFVGSTTVTRFLEFFSYTITGQIRGDFLQNTPSNGSDYKHNGGYGLVASVSNQFQITPIYSYGFGYMIDYNGRRFERHDAHTLTFDARKMITLVLRIVNRDLEPDSKKIQEIMEKYSFCKRKNKT